MYDGEHRGRLARELGAAMLTGGPWRADDLAERAGGCLDGRPAWLARLAVRVAAVHRVAPLDRPGRLTETIEAFLAELNGPDDSIGLIRDRPAGAGPVPTVRSRMTPPRRELAAWRWPVVRLASADELAEHLELSPGQLAWLADCRGLERRAGEERLRNYRYRTVGRPHGLPRLLEIPKARLKEIQRWVLRRVLAEIPAHDAAHGFTPGRSVVTHAQAHAGRAVLARFDLRDFFSSVPAGRVFGVFVAAGYPPSVARTLTGLCTNAIPVAVWAAVPHPPAELVPSHFWLGRRLATPHLPQGAPTSPALANLAAFRLDRRLAGLADAIGARYTRYADDLTFSGGPALRRRSRGLAASVAEIAAAEGFALHPDKTAVHTQAARQTICGVVVNVRPNVRRAEFDRLKATLHRLACDGPPPDADADALRAQLRGRIAWIASVNPARGARLLARFEAVDWAPR